MRIFYAAKPLLFSEYDAIIVIYDFERGITMSLSNAIAAGNVSANVYLIVVIVAAVLIVGAVVAGIISKKNKK